MMLTKVATDLSKNGSFGTKTILVQGNKLNLCFLRRRSNIMLTGRLIFEGKGDEVVQNSFLGEVFLKKIKLKSFKAII